MRAWLPAVAALTLVTLTGPLAAGEKRTSALAVRVTVVRSCSVSTDGGVIATGTVTCGSRFGPPVMSVSSTITMPASTQPAARITPAEAPVPPVQGQEATMSSSPETAQVEPRSEDASAAAAEPPVPGGADAESADGLLAGRAETVAFRLVTVNF